MHKLIIFMTIEQKEQPEYTSCGICGKKMVYVPLRDRCGECQRKYWDEYIAGAREFEKECREKGIPFNMGGTFDG